MKNDSKHPQWAVKHRKPGTELKLIGGKYYLYGVTSVYDKTTKKSRKISLGIIGRITEEDGLIPSDKRILKEKCQLPIDPNELFLFEYGYSKWLVETLESEGITKALKSYFPDLWQYIVLMVYCRTAHKSPLKNIPFLLSQSHLSELIGLKETMTDQKISDSLFNLGSKKANH